MVGADDQHEISRLIAAYPYHLDRGDIESLLTLFCVDAELWPSHAGAQRYVGHDALREYYEHHRDAVRGALRSVRHKTAAPAIVEEARGASSECYFDADGIERASGRVRVVAGRYADRFVIDGGAWLIASRTIGVDYTYLLPAEIQVVSPRAGDSTGDGDAPIAGPALSIEQ